jgi:predicted aspartyl protease
LKLLIAAALLTTATLAVAEPLRVHNGRLYIDAKVAGVATEALLDSGAEATLIDPGFAAAARIPEGEPLKIKGSGGEAEARVVPDVIVEAVETTLHPEAVVITDLRELSTRLLKWPTQVVVGRELFDATKLAIDINRGTIEPAGAAAVWPGKRLALTAHAGIETIPVTVDGVRAQAEFDLGNGSDVMVSREMAKRLSLKIVGQKSGGGIGGEVMRNAVVLKRLELAGKTFRNVPATIDDQPSADDLNIGTSILRNFLIITDFHGRAVWLQARKPRSE